MKSATQDIEELIARLYSNGRVRVWSLIITFFGDAVSPRGGEVSLSALTDAMALLRIEPGSVRTSMSRLTKEGWVAREREGRLSFYKLTPEGRSAFDAPTLRIYAGGPPQWNGDWTLVTVMPGSETALGNLLLTNEFVQIGPASFLRAETAVSEDVDELLTGLFVLRGKAAEFPRELLRLWKLDELGGQYHGFISNWRKFEDKPRSFNPAEAMIARTLLIHDWRRIVLRDPALPSDLLPDDWAGTQALKLVRHIYAQLLEQSEAWLDDARLPAATDRGHLSSRFNMLQNIAK
jgi:phenylacetic acid degradation operon negative regulatory protein